MTTLLKHPSKEARRVPGPLTRSFPHSLASTVAHEFVDRGSLPNALRDRVEGRSKGALTPFLSSLIVDEFPGKRLGQRSISYVPLLRREACAVVLGKDLSRAR